MAVKKICFIFGTRPEAIKFAPLVAAFKADAAFQTVVCVTGQHRNMLDQVLDFFDIVPDYDLNIMTPNQTLSSLTAKAIGQLAPVIESEKPDLIFVQGDTTSTFVGGLVGYYHQCKVAHLEAGLRSGQKYSPFPEEMNRILTGHLADWHFTPTPKATAHLAKEGIVDGVWDVGNTVIDALFLGLEKIKSESENVYYERYSQINFSSRVILVTSHRRESFGAPFENICLALDDIVDQFDDVELVYPVHLNPKIKEPVHKALGGRDRIHLIEPVAYPDLIWLMNQSVMVLTDSGGIQEEAPSLGKPVLVMRDVTERMEGVDAGCAQLVGTDREKIVGWASKLLTQPDEYEKMSQSVNPYGDGSTSTQIVEIVKQHL